MRKLRRVRKVDHLRQRNNNDNDAENDIDQSKDDDRETKNDLKNQIHRSRLVLPQSNASLLRLPTELIFQVGEILASPCFTVQHWGQSNTDVLNFSATCRSIRCITRPLLYNQLIITIDQSKPTHSLSHAINRLQELSDPSHHSHQTPIKKLLIKDDGPDLNNSHRTRQSWYTLLSHALRHRLDSVQFFCYTKNLESVTESSPYQLLNIDPSLIHSVSTLKHLETLYLSGLTLPQRSTRRNSTNFGESHNLSTLHLIAVHDSLLNLIRHCSGLKELRIWRDFLIPFPAVHHWINIRQWPTLENLKLKGFYGNSVIHLQNSLIETGKNLWAQSLSKMQKLKRFTWNCSPFTCHDLIHIQAGMKSQAMILAKIIPTLERVAYVDISGWLEIRRKPRTLTSRKNNNRGSVIPCIGGTHGAPNHQSAAAIKSIKWAGVTCTYPFMTTPGFFGLDSESEDLLDEQESEEDEEEEEETDGHENQKEDPTNQPKEGENDVDGIVSNELLQENMAVTGRKEKAHQSNSSAESNLKKKDLNPCESKPRRRPIDDPFSVTRSSNSSRIPNSSLTSRLTKLSSSVSCESDLIRTSNKGRTRTRLSSSHLKPSSSSSSTKAAPSNRVARRSSRLINSHSYPDLLISQILEINRCNTSSRAHRSSSSSSSSDFS